MKALFCVIVAVALAGCGAPSVVSPVGPSFGAEASKKDAQQALQTAFFKACSLNNVEQVKDGLANGADVKATDRYGETALMKSAAHCYRSSAVDVVKLLLEAGSDVNVKSKKGNTALKLATEYAGGVYAKYADPVILALKAAGAE